MPFTVLERSHRIVNVPLVCEWLLIFIPFTNAGLAQCECHNYHICKFTFVAKIFQSFFGRRSADGYCEEGYMHRIHQGLCELWVA